MLVRAVVAIRGVEFDLNTAALFGSGKTFQIGHCRAGRDLILIGDGKCGCVTAQQFVATGFAAVFDEVVLQFVVPAAHDTRNFMLECYCVIVIARASRHAGNKVQTGEAGFA